MRHPHAVYESLADRMNDLGSSSDFADERRKHLQKLAKLELTWELNKGSMLLVNEAVYTR